MSAVKSKDAIARMRDSCRIAATVLAKMREMVTPGITTYDLDQEGRKLIESYGATSACYNYKVGPRRFPAYTCISVNEEVVHGIGSLKRILRPGDVVSLDVTVEYNGYIGDNALTVMIPPVAPEVAELVQVTEEALSIAVSKAVVGNRIGDLSHAVQTFVEGHGFGVVREMVGHGVGSSMHEPRDPQGADVVRRMDDRHRRRQALGALRTHRAHDRKRPGDPHDPRALNHFPIL